MKAGVINGMPQLDVIRASPLCANCGLPRD